MRIHTLHSWDVNPSEAVALQRQLAARLDTRSPLPEARLIAGADISYNRFSDLAYAQVVVLRADDLAVVETRSAVHRMTFPYVPGLLTFREGPALLKAFALVESEPDVVMFDGQGTAHPRRLGIACHLGLWLDRPCFGCAKSLLTGAFQGLGPEAGSTAPLLDRGEVVGEAVRTKTKVNPVYVSPGHRIDLAGAVRWTLATAAGYRIPEPTRQAHLGVNALRRQLAITEEGAGDGVG